MATVFIRGEGGTIFELELPLHETIQDKLRKGHVQRVTPEGGPVEVVDGEDTVPGLPDQRPAVNALKTDWVGWAVRQGARPDDAAAMTKRDLIDAYGKDTPPQTIDGRPDGGDAQTRNAAGSVNGNGDLLQAGTVQPDGIVPGTANDGQGDALVDEQAGQGDDAQAPA